MDIENLIERLNQYSQSLIAFHMGGEFSDVCVDAATALSALQAENEEMQRGNAKTAQHIFRVLVLHERNVHEKHK